MKPMQYNINSLWLSLIVSLFMCIAPLALYAHTTEAPKVEIPTTIPAIWKAVDENASSINQAIKDFKLTSIHKHAYAIRDLVNALPALSNDLPAEQKKILQDNLIYVNQLATRLDKTGDTEDKEGTAANWDKLQKVLVQLKQLFSLDAK